MLLFWYCELLSEKKLHDLSQKCVFFLSFSKSRSMKCWDLPSIKVGFANGAEIGLKIDEKFKEGDLVTFLKNYADGNGIGGNIITSRLLIKYTMENNTSNKSNVLK